MIENFCRCWGGVGDVMVPVKEDGSVAPALWATLERYDPDRLSFYVPTYRGHQMANPESFERWLDASSQRLADENEETSYEEARGMLLDEHFLSGPLSSWRPPASLESEVRRRLAPLNPDHPFSLNWVADGSPSNRLLDVINIREIEVGPPISSLRAAKIDPRIDLMLITRLGAISPSFHVALDERRVPVVDASATLEQLSYVLDLSWERDINSLRRKVELLRSLEDMVEAPWPLDLQNRFPFSLTHQGCGWYIVGTPWRQDLPHVLVVGDSAEDYSLFLLLDRMYGQTDWCPYAFLHEDSDIAKVVRRQLSLKLLSDVGPYREDSETICVTSISLDEGELDAAVSTIADNEWVGGMLSSRLKTCVPTVLPLPKPFRLYDSDYIVRTRYEPFVGSEMAGTLETPKPSSISPVSPLNFTWQVDALIDGVQYPPRSCLGPLVGVHRIADHTSIRTGSDGISYFSQEPFFIPAGASLEQMIYRPCLRQPEAAEVFQALLSAAGLRGVMSQAGRFSNGLLAIWGGLEAAAEDLRDPRRNALFDAYRKKSPSGVDPGVYLAGTKRRYLSFWDARRATGLSGDEMRSLIDAYTAKGVLARGLCLKCPRCSFAAWYPSEELGQRFRCSRCRAESWITQEAWKKPSEPLWFYQLDEIAFQAIDHDARAPILALDAIRRDSRSFIFAPEMDVFDGGARVAEIDLLAIADGKILIGEAKTIERLESSDAEERATAAKLTRVAEAATAHELVMATTASQWSDRTIRTLDELTAGRMQLRLLTSLGVS